MHPSLLHPPTADARRALLDPDGETSEPLDPLLLAEIAAGLALSVARAPVPTGCGSDLLLEARHYSAWRVTWPTGTVWDGAGRATAALHVVHGEVTEHWTDLLHLDQRARVVRAGESMALGPRLAARIENRGPQTAVLVHVTTRSTAVLPCDEQLRLVG